jgi:hypothetical protein
MDATSATPDQGLRNLLATLEYRARRCKQDIEERLATIPYGGTDMVEVVCLSESASYADHDLALPVSIIWTRVEGNMADVHCVEGTFLASHWLGPDWEMVATLPESKARELPENTKRRGTE